MKKNRIPIEPRAQAIKLLARREHSARDLERKLLQRGIPQQEAAQAVDEVRKDGWQSDVRFAQLLVRSRVSQGYGPLRIKAELQQAGMAREEIETAIAEAGADWREACSAAHAKKFRGLPSSYSERGKQYRFLQGRGFDSSQISATLKGESDYP